MDEQVAHIVGFDVHHPGATDDPCPRLFGRLWHQEAKMTVPTSREVLEGFLSTLQAHGARRAFEQYAVEDYVQHNPKAGRGREGAIAYLEEEAAKGGRATVKRIISDGAMVALHLHMEFTDGSPDLAIVDIWRVEEGKLAEHWDVAQEITKTSISEAF
ncbi:nuclear transport factor 2 family protein [Streptomyces sp. NPDC005799]|uniref:nuclear transport factor 2 family protein n=1 Tax=Streptomyces sp. NPDC005799 TaxID=3154678 RepID=UPI0033C6EAE7